MNALIKNLKIIKSKQYTSYQNKYTQDSKKKTDNELSRINYYIFWFF